MKRVLPVLVFAASLCAFGQQTIAAAKPDDVKSIDSLCKALYQVISGPPGAKHDWDRMRSLFSADAKMMAIVKDRAGKLHNRAFSVEDYIKLSGAYIEKNGFAEQEIARKTEQFGNMAHVFSTYESHFAQTGKPTTERGINSIQLFNDGTRWWVVSIFWEDESSGGKLPDKYLRGL